jgi:GxxExxY protein
MSVFHSIAKTIYETLGPGFSEAIYHNALEVELRSCGMEYETERIIPISFKEHVVGNVRADLIVAKSIIIEIKAIAKLRLCDRLQLENYMKLTGCEFGVLLNFGPSLEVEEVSSPVKSSQSPVAG